VRLTRKAKNGLRWLKGTAQEAEAVVKNEFGKDFDPDGNRATVGTSPEAAVEWWWLSTIRT